MSVDAYNNDDWQKLKAAVNALKNPVLDESIVLEASPIGDQLQLEYIRSQSTPNIPDTTEEVEALRIDRDSHFRYESPIPSSADQPKFGLVFRTMENGDRGELEVPYHMRPRRASAGGILYPVIKDVAMEGQQPHARADPTNSGKSLINQWVLELPDYGRRSRSHTEPIQPPESIFKSDILTKRSTMPRFTSPPPPPCPPPEELPPPPEQLHPQTEVKSRAKPGTASRSRTVSGEEHAGSPACLSVSASVQDSVPRKVSTSSSQVPAEARPSASPMSPTVSLPASTLVKVYMNRVQKGEHVFLNDRIWHAYL